ncbi:Domain of unknown function DUF1724 [Methanosalsum zhilinae DSM 4017]|uniref:Methanogenesis regulatory protein FilR1 middle domain-containing protein n=1 Tax=Methanosalsum zhilinae (strain DSM 4017 / NBRC 107636 / OCM 62 / WeN5) TaxID=679901 RepID=F7XP72_METZD|nr:winged helix-turn-helix domain-containing protein [Methanosalsum zhilinae]AEH61366.1 Domain of unknown function DUF1724 [Methanosalsum zhilinae DSM 4017]
MKLALSDAIWISDKRRNLLLLLTEGPRNIDQIKAALNVNSRSMMPQIKILKDWELIEQQGEFYILTDTGKLLVENMQPLLDSLNVIEENKEYWCKRDLSSIPPHILKRIGELGHYFIIEQDINHLFELPKEFTENIPKSRSIMSFAAYFHPVYPSIYSEIIDNGSQLSLMFTRPVFNRMKEDYSEYLDKILASENCEVLVCDEQINLPTITVTDWFLYISFFDHTGRYDHKIVMSFDSDALRWGEDLFDHYKSSANRIDK